MAITGPHPGRRAAHGRGLRRQRVRADHRARRSAREAAAGWRWRSWRRGPGCCARRARARARCARSGSQPRDRAARAHAGVERRDQAGGARAGLGVALQSRVAVELELELGLLATISPRGGLPSGAGTWCARRSGPRAARSGGVHGLLRVARRRASAARTDATKPTRGRPPSAGRSRRPRGASAGPRPARCRAPPARGRRSPTVALRPIRPMRHIAGAAGPRPPPISIPCSREHARPGLALPSTPSGTRTAVSGASWWSGSASSSRPRVAQPVLEMRAGARRAAPSAPRAPSSSAARSASCSA